MVTLNRVGFILALLLPALVSPSAASAECGSEYVSVSGATAVREGEELALLAEIVGGESGQFTSPRWLDDGGALLQNGFSLARTLSCAGPVTFEFTATDTLCGGSISEEVTVGIYNRVSEISHVALSSRTPAVGESVRIDFTVTEPCNRALVWQVWFGDETGGSPGASGSATAAPEYDGTASHAWTEPGTHELRIVAIDPLSAPGDEAIAEWTDVVLVAPGETTDTRDDDRDGILDALERFFGLNPYDPTDASLDPDGDGISNRDEIEAGSHPYVSNAPAPPALTAPPADAIVTDFPVQFALDTPLDPDGDDVTAEIAIYSDATLSRPVLVLAGLEPAGAEIRVNVDEEDLADGHSYWWRARGDDGRGEGEWSEARGLRLDVVNAAPSAPLPLAPFGVVETTTPIFRWTPSQDIAGESFLYVIEVFSDEAGSASVLEVEVDDEITEASPGGLSDNTDYWWRISARDERGASSDLPARLTAIRVNTDNAAPLSPVLISPGEGERRASSTVTLTVENGSDPDGDTLSVEAQWSLDGSFADPGVSTTAGAGGRTTLSATIPTSGEYTWRARMSDGARSSDWATGTFEVRVDNAAPSAPTLVEPADGSTVDSASPTLSVDAGEDAEGDPLTVDIEIYADAALSLPVARYGDIPASDGSATQELAEPLADGQRYWWRARATDDWNLDGAWSSPSAFLVDASNAAPGSPGPLRPADDSRHSEGMPIVLEVQNAIDTDGDSLAYRFEVSPGDDFAQITEASDWIEAGGRGVTRYTIRALLPAGTWHWRARATDGEQEGNDSAAMSFVVYVPALASDAGGGDGGGCGCSARPGPARLGGIVLLLLGLLSLRGRGRRAVAAIGLCGAFGIGGLLGFPRSALAADVLADMDVPGFVEVGQTVTFDGRWSLPDPDALTFEWRVDDIILPETGPLASYTFGSVGVASVSLAVTLTATGDSAYTHQDVVVLPHPVSLSEISVTPFPVTRGRVTSFRVSVDHDGDRELDALWSAGDLSPSVVTHLDPDDSFTFVHSFAASEMFTVSVVVRADGEVVATLAVDVDVREPLLPPGDQDTDGDGVPDEVENAYGLDPYDPWDVEEDPDGDGISTAMEIAAGTGPFASNAPGLPSVNAPSRESVLIAAPVTLSVNRAPDPDGDEEWYEFALYDGRTRPAPVAVLGPVDPSGGTATTAAISGLAEDSLVCWSARGCDEFACGPWMDRACFTLDLVNAQPASPGLLRPFAIAGSTTPEFAIVNPVDPEGDAVEIRFDVETEAGASVDSSPWLPAGQGGITLWTVTTALSDGGDYRWTAIARDGRGGESEAPAPLAFSVNPRNAAPGGVFVLSPSDGARQSVPDLTVTIENAEEPDGDAMLIEVEIADNDSFEEALLTASPADDSGFTSTTVSVPESGEYWLRARATDGAAAGPWSIVAFEVRFENQPPPVPLRVAPAEPTVTSNRPVLEVGGVEDAEGDSLTWEFEVYADAELAELLQRSPQVESAGNGNGAWTVASPLNTGYRYFWRARAVDDWGGVSGWTETAAFLVTLSNAPPGAPALDRPADGAELAEGSPVTLLVLQPTDPDGDLLTLEIEVYSDEGMQQIDHSAEGIDAVAALNAYTVPTRLAPGSHYWRARAHDGTVFGAWSDTRSFRIVSPRGVLSPEDLDGAGGGAGGDGGGCSVAPVRVTGALPVAVLALLALWLLRRRSRAA